MTQGKETKMTLTERLSRLQRQLKAPKEANKGVQYKSRSAEQILEAAKENLLDGEYILLNDEIQFVGARYYVKATATFGFGEDKISCTGWANEDAGSSPIKGAQLTGACSSYARKYALGGLTALDDSRDDPDKQPEHDEKPKAQEPPKPKTTEEKKAEAIKTYGQEMIDTYELIANAISSAKDEKQVNTILTVQSANIEKMHETVRGWIAKSAYNKKLALFPINAG